MNTSDHVSVKTPTLSATVVTLKDSPEGLMVLLLKRNPELKVLGDYWVFPGGAVEASDGTDNRQALRQAAIRETREEAGISVGDLLPFSRWLTPETVSRRFDTHFFLAKATAETVRVDGQEIIASQWLSPQKAITLHQTGRLKMMPPTLVTLLSLTDHSSMSAAFARFENRPLQQFLPRVGFSGDQAVMLYEGDAGFDAQDPDIPGDRHRCVLNGEHWEYIREG